MMDSSIHKPAVVSYTLARARGIDCRTSWCPVGCTDDLSGRYGEWNENVEKEKDADEHD